MWVGDGGDTQELFMLLHLTDMNPKVESVIAQICAYSLMLENFPFMNTTTKKYISQETKVN